MRMLIGPYSGALRLSLFFLLFLLPLSAPVCNAQCYGAPADIPLQITVSPQSISPGYNYTITITNPLGYFYNNTGPNFAVQPEVYVVTAANFETFTEDPNVTTSNLTFVNANTITFNVSVAAGAPVEDDAISLFCNGSDLFLAPGSLAITPCAPPAPVISSIQPAAFFAGAPTGVTITGTGFVPTSNTGGCSASTLAITAGTENVALSNVNVVSSTEITAVATSLAADPLEGASVTVSNVNYNSPPATLISNAEPADILPVPVIYYNGNPISGAGATTPSGVVGQQIQLTTNTPTAVALSALPVPLTFPSGPASGPQPYVWQFQGGPIANYTPTATSYQTGSVVPLNLNLANETVYWPYPNPTSGPWGMTYQYCVNGPGFSNNCGPQTATNFTVTGPTGGSMSVKPYSSVVSIASLNACTGHSAGPYLVYASGTISGTACNYGQNVAPANAGINFDFPTGYQNEPSGAFYLVQLIGSDTVYGKAYAPGLDTMFPYGGPPSDDSPGNLLLPAAGTVTRNFTANMFLMWKSTLANAIYVPLGYQTWGFDGNATCTASCGDAANWKAGTTGSPGPIGGWTPSAPSETSAGDTANILVEGFPTWTGIGG